MIRITEAVYCTSAGNCRAESLQHCNSHYEKDKTHLSRKDKDSVSVESSLLLQELSVQERNPDIIIIIIITERHQGNIRLLCCWKHEEGNGINISITWLTARSQNPWLTTVYSFYICSCLTRVINGSVLFYSVCTFRRGVKSPSGGNGSEAEDPHINPVNLKAEEHHGSVHTKPLLLNTGS